jgi:hypothetical protein
MALTYGYNLKEGDDMIAAPIQASEIMTQLLLPGAALVNNFPSCAFPFVAMTIVLTPHDHSQ